jgi:hypothetical protein
MDDVTRRAAIRTSAGTGLLAALAPAAGANAADDDGKGDAPASERDRVRAVGMTEAEIECWMLAANLAGRFFALPEMHPMDKQEISTAIHVVQNKLLSRPTYRRYLEEARKAAEKK